MKSGAFRKKENTSENCFPALAVIVLPYLSKMGHSDRKPRDVLLVFYGGFFCRFSYAVYSGAQTLVRLNKTHGAKPGPDTELSFHSTYWKTKKCLTARQTENYAYRLGINFEPYMTFPRGKFGRLTDIHRYFNSLSLLPRWEMRTRTSMRYTYIFYT